MFKLLNFGSILDIETTRNLYKSIVKAFKNIKSITIDLIYYYVCYVNKDIIQKIEYTTTKIHLKKNKNIIFFCILYINSKTIMKSFEKEKQIYTYINDLLYIDFQSPIFIKGYKCK